MKKRLQFPKTLAGRFAILVIMLALTAAWQAQAQPVIAHWSFDAETLSIDSGNITNVTDATGNHDAFVSDTGYGAAAASTAFTAASDSIAGQFGEGLRFNGDNYMVFPNLTQLMQSAGAPSYTISMWVKWLNAGAPGGGTPYSTLGDWGNAASGTAGVNSRYTYAFGPNGANSLRIQARAVATGNGNGTDIIAQSTTGTPAVNDGSWHMLTWTFDTTNGECNIYFDGVLQQTVTSGAASFAMADSASEVGAMGLKADNANFLPADTELDEVWVFEGVASSNEVTQLYQINAIVTQGQDLTWQGGVDTNWDTATLNWLPGAGPATSFKNGDVVLLDDTADTGSINLVQRLIPWGLTITNDSLDYSFAGSGSLAAASEGLMKRGTGTLTIANTGDNNFGAVTILGGTLQVGDGGSGGSLGATMMTNNASLVFNRTGTLTVGAAISGTGSLTHSGSGTVMLTGENTYTGSTAVAGGTLALGTGGTLTASPVSISSAGFDASAASPVTLVDLSLSNATLTVAVADGSDAITATTYAGDGSNTINVSAMPDVLVYPHSFTAIKYTTLNAGTPTYVLGTLPLPLMGAYAGYVSNNVANKSIDVVITSGPALQTWAGYSSGAPNSSWDTTTLNWRSAADAAIAYTDGLRVGFNDSASNATVSLDAVVTPGNMYVDNSVLDYTFNGANYITGPGKLTKDGSGKLTLDNTGINDFTGGVLINSGTLQIGNNSYGGNLPAGSVVNDGALVFARADEVTVANMIAGSGSLDQNAASTLTLSGANTFSGPVTVAQGTLKTDNDAALGSTNGATTVVSGATLDVNHSNLGDEPVFATGSGVFDVGAIINTGGNQNNAMRDVTLTGNTSFGGTGRWDIRQANGNGRLSTGGNAYNITKVGDNQVSLVSIDVDPALGDVDIVSGRFSVEANTTTLGDTTKMVTVRSGGTFAMYRTTNLWDKIFVVEDGGTIHDDDRDNTIIGPIELASSGGYHTFDVDNNTLTLAGVLTGGGLIYKVDNGNLLLSGDSPNFAGGGYFFGGNVTLSGTLSNALGVEVWAGSFAVDGTLLGEGVTNYAGALVSGSGTINGAVDIGGDLVAGTSGTAGTLTTGDLTLESGVILTEDLALNPAVGSGINDLIQVNGNLTMNANDIYVNRLDADLLNGTYTLLTYTGTFSGTLGNVYLNGDQGSYVLTLNQVTGSSPKRIDLVVTGGVSVNTTPTPIVSSVSGSNLTLSWPVDHTGWRLQVQTNVLSTGISTNWYDVAGSTLTNEVTMPIDPANPSAFFQLVYP